MAKTTMSKLAAKLGEAGRKAFEEHKNDELVLSGGGECPAGIENGVAQLVDIKFGEYENGDMKGQLYCYLAGIVVAPKFVFGPDGSKIPCAGLRTSNIEPLCDTPNRSRKTVSDHMGWIQNELRKLGLETRSLSWDKLESAAEALVQSAPYFQFRTWASKPTPEFPNPRTNHTWGKSIPDYESDTNPDADVVDETTDTEPESAPKKTATTSQPTKSAPVKGAKQPAVEEVPFGDDLDMTADKADNGDGKAMNFLKNRAVELGYSEEEVDNSASWQEVAEMIRAKEAAFSSDDSTEEIDWNAIGEEADGGDTDASEKITEWATENGIDVNDHAEKTWTEFVTFVQESLDGGEAETEELVPEKGNVYLAELVKGKKPTQVEVMAVFEEKRTVNVKDLDTNKPYKNISWDALKEVS